jgi:hypothetical protein
VVSAALPPLSAAVPSELTPSKNWTVPVDAAGETVAVNVTGWPNVDVGADEATVVVVDVWVWPHDGNLNDPMRVLQFAEAVIAWYSCVYQNRQSSLGSIRIAE